MSYEEQAIQHNKETKEALQTLYDSITAKGQRKQLLKKTKVIELLDRYGVEYEKDL